MEDSDEDYGGDEGTSATARNRTTRGTRNRARGTTTGELAPSSEVETEPEDVSSSQRKRGKISLARYMKLQKGESDAETDGEIKGENGGDLEGDEDGMDVSGVESARGNEFDDNGTISNMIRAIIGRSNTNKVVPRSSLRQCARGSIRFEAAFEALNEVLSKVWGLRLQALDKETSKSKSYMLVSDLTATEKEILDQLWVNVDQVHENNQRQSNEEQFFMAKHERDKLPGENSEVIKTAITSMVLSTIIIEENHLSKTRLVKVLKNFGLSDNPIRRNSNIDGNITTILEDLERRDYIKNVFVNRNPSNDTTKRGRNREGDELVFYSLGSRALLEFTPMVFFNFIKEVYGERFDTIVKDKVLITLQKAFNRSFEDQLNPTNDTSQNEPSQNNSDRDPDLLDADPDQKPSQDINT